MMFSQLELPRAERNFCGELLVQSLYFFIKVNLASETFILAKFFGFLGRLEMDVVSGSPPETGI